MGRSKNPDLIFENILNERVDRVGGLYLKDGFQAPFDLDRVTLFVTHKCNLFCNYCNGPHMNKDIPSDERKEMLQADVSLEQYTKLIDDWGKHKLKHIHFTGGEATLNPHLLKFVKMAKERSILSSLTTNGTADPELYRQLVNAGLTEVRISIDSAVDEEFDKLVGVKGACNKVKNNINYLADMRDKGKDLFMVLNACVGSFNVKKIKSTIEPLLELGADDVKLLVVAEQGKYVCSKSSRNVVDELTGYVKSKNKDYELLEKKIQGLFRKNTSGLKDPSAQHELQQCFIPLTERTLDARGFYPCSIYLRYRGKPLVDADSSFEEQQIAIDHFVETQDCRDDPICIDNCTNCCKQFNIGVNRKVRKYVALQKARKKGGFMVEKIGNDEVKEVIKTYEQIKSVNSDDNNPFIIIKPQGLDYEKDIKLYLKDQNVDILNELPIEDWKNFSLFLYFKDAKDRSAEFKLARNKAYGQFEKRNSSKLLLLENNELEKKLFRIKHELRNWYGEDVGFFTYDGQDARLISNCIHVPNYKDLNIEHKVIKFLLS